MIHTEFNGTIVITSADARAEVVGTDHGLRVRFPTVRDLRTFSKQAGSAKPRSAKLPEGAILRIEVGGREFARIGGAQAPWWTPSGLCARASGLPVSGIRARWWLGR